MNPFVSFPTQPIYGQFLIPIDIGSRMAQPIMILNYNSSENQLGMPSYFTCVSNNLPLEETNSLTLNSHAHHLYLNNEPPQQSTAQHVSPSSRSTTLDETNLYPPSLHIECDKLYLSYLESSQSKPSPTDNFIEDSFKNESTKSVDDLFSLQLDCEEFFSPQLNEHTSNFDAGESQNESDGQLLFIPVSDVDSNNNSISSHNHSVSTNPTESIHEASTTCSVIKAAINQVSNNSKPKRQRPLSMQTSDSLNKKVKPTNSNNNQITWHHVSIDSNMNQQENTFVYDNSYNIFESFTPQPSSLHNNSSSSSSTIVPPSSSNNKSSDSTCTCNNISFLHSSIIIETPESISKKMKRGRPKKDFQIE